jgi:large subunit ribosomal protein L31
MQTSIHPTMHADAKTTCTTCQTVYLIPSTVQTQTVEACRACHPQYTGKKQTTTKGGRIERFRKLQSASKAA